MKVIKFAHFTLYAERPEDCAKELIASLGYGEELLECDPENGFFLGRLGKGIFFEVIPAAGIIRMTHGIHPVALRARATVEVAHGPSRFGHAEWTLESCDAVTLLNPLPNDDTVAVLETPDLERCLRLWDRFGFRVVSRSENTGLLEAKFPLNSGRIGLRIVLSSGKSPRRDHVGVGLIGLCTTHLQEAYEDLSASGDVLLSDILRTHVGGRTIDYFYVSTDYCGTIEVYSWHVPSALTKPA